MTSLMKKNCPRPLAIQMLSNQKKMGGTPNKGTGPGPAETGVLQSKVSGRQIKRKTFDNEVMPSVGKKKPRTPHGTPGIVNMSTGGNSPKFARPSCGKFDCAKYGLCCSARVAARCARNGHSARWYHISLLEHYCNDCFEYFYRSSKPGFAEMHQWRSLWSISAKSEGTMKMFMVDSIIPFWLQCTLCGKWREVPNSDTFEVTGMRVKGFRCTDLHKISQEYQSITCETEEDKRVVQAISPTFVESVANISLQKFSPAAPYMGAYYPEGVGLSPTCELVQEANTEFTEKVNKNKLKLSQNGSRPDFDRTEFYPTVPGVNKFMQPFYQPTDNGKALTIRPDCMEFDELQAFPEHVRSPVLYLGIRNLIIALWNRDFKKWLQPEDVTCRLIVRGILRIYCIEEAKRILNFLIARGLVNTGILKSPPNFSLIPKDCKEHVIIIGAGFSGLSASRHLVNAGVNVTVVEAKDRIGGRIWDEAYGKVRCGRGGQIVTGVTNNPMTVMCEQGGLPMRILRDRCDIYDETGKMVDPADDEGMEYHYNQILDSIRDWKAKSKIDETLYDRIWECHNKHIEEVPQLQYTEDQMKLFRFHMTNLEYACGSSLKNISALAWDHNESFAQFTGSHALLPMGYSSIIEKLAEGVNVKLNSEVQEVNYSTSEIIVKLKDGSSVVGTRVLVSVPLAVLQKKRIEFSPPLSKQKQDALAALGSGIIEKVILEFPVKFWATHVEDVDYFGYATADNSKPGPGWCNMFYDMNPVSPKDNSSHLLMTYICGDAVLELQTLKDHEVVDNVVKVLRKIFVNETVPEPKSYIVTHWQSDPHIGMSYSYVKAGGTGSAYDVLNDTIETRIFFAGEATNRHFPQSATGAHLSGVCEGSKILSAIQACPIET